MLSGLLKLIGYLNPDVLKINNFLLLLPVFGPALLVTIILVPLWIAGSLSHKKLTNYIHSKQPLQILKLLFMPIYLKGLMEFMQGVGDKCFYDIPVEVPYELE